MKKISAMVVGCGDRALVYATEGCKNLKNMKIAACVDPDISKLEMMKREFNVPAGNCFTSVEEAAARGKICDCVINGTMDRLHVPTTLPLLELGYDVLLEKPICNNEKDLLLLRDAAEKNGCRLFICHVLRYSPFYRKIKEIILSGEIGKIVHINTYEHVGVFLTSVSFVRGKWSKQSECGSSLLLAKCCHDMDLICWLNNGTVPDSVYSDGGRTFLVPENAPEGSGTRCLVDCPAEVREKCIFDAKPMYLDNCLLPWYPWQCTGKDYREITDEEKESSLKTYNPHGRCAYKCDGDIADHQTVSVKFKNGSYATHSVTLSSFRDGRDIFAPGLHDPLLSGHHGRPPLPQPGLVPGSARRRKLQRRELSGAEPGTPCKRGNPAGFPVAYHGGHLRCLRKQPPLCAGPAESLGPVRTAHLSKRAAREGVVQGPPVGGGMSALPGRVLTGDPSGKRNGARRFFPFPRKNR